MYGRDEREDIGNQGEENVKTILTHHFGQNSVQTTNGQGGNPDIYLATDRGRMCIDVKSMLPFSVDKNKKGKKVRKVGYAHLNKFSWAGLNSFARGTLSNVAVIIEVRFRHHPFIYFLLRREDIEDFLVNVKEKSVWANIPFWYVHERGIGFDYNTPPEFDWTPLETTQVQIGVE